MKVYTVTMESGDGQIFVVEVTTSTTKEAIELAKKKIIDLGWEHYGYEVKDISESQLMLD